jgi:hypothetical protein
MENKFMKTKMILGNSVSDKVRVYIHNYVKESSIGSVNTTVWTVDDLVWSSVDISVYNSVLRLVRSSVYRSVGRSVHSLVRTSINNNI